ncbi:MAG: CBS domain-containing protein [Caldilineaceae bacterium]|nr:CBS domain-containing protein [Caldilineaceae bacterium]
MTSQLARHRMEVRDWMTPNPVTVAPDAPLAEAYRLMEENEVRRLPVVNKQRELVGIITRSDLLQHVPFFPDEEELEEELPYINLTVEEVMSYDPISIESTDTIQAAAELMLEAKISGLPVRAGNRLVGIITESDIFRLVVAEWGEGEG